VFILSKPQRRLFPPGESLLSDKVACCPQGYGDSHGWAGR
jgi:hypothetical protein